MLGLSPAANLCTSVEQNFNFVPEKPGIERLKLGPDLLKSVWTF
jgi:hypothetical protein